jgi:hypothetical protein
MHDGHLERVEERRRGGAREEGVQAHRFRPREGSVKHS